MTVVLRGTGFIFLLLLSVAGYSRCDLRPAPAALPVPESGELLLVTQNLWRFVDDYPDTHADRPLDSDYLALRIDAVAAYIGEVLRWPHLLALQEVEHAKILKRLMQRITALGGPRYQFAMQEGLDPSGIDVALLYRDPVVVEKVSSPFHSSRYKRSPLFSRPPLVVSVAAPLAMQLVVVHLRSGINLEDKRKGKNIQEKRRQQAQALRDWMEREKQHGRHVVVAGDFNSAFGDEIYQQPIAILDAVPFKSVWGFLPEDEQFSYIYQCRPQAIDNILFDELLVPDISRVAVSRGNAGYQYALYKKTPPYLISDHDALAIYMRYQLGEKN